jgi:hypothetical protein
MSESNTARKIDAPPPDPQRRRVPRRAIKNRAGLLHRGHYCVGSALEIGEGGILVTSAAQMVEGDRVVVTLRIPEVLQGVMTASVAYVLRDPAGVDNKYGLQFESVDFEIKRKIRNFVASATHYVAD